MKWYWIAILFLLWSCGHKVQKKTEVVEMKGTVKSSQMQIIPVSPEAVAKDIKYSEFIDPESVEVVQLETNDESLLADVTRLEVIKNKIYIYDRKQSAVFVFSLSGKYLGKVDRMGRGPKEYPLVCDFCVDGEWIGILNFDRLLFYHLDEPDSVRILDLRDQGVSGLAMYSDDSCFYFRPSNIRVVSGSAIVCDKAGKIKSVLAEPGYAKTVAWRFPPFFIPVEEKMYYHQIFNDTLYQITDSALVAAYVFDCGDRTLSFDDYLKYGEAREGIPDRYMHSLYGFRYADSTMTFIVKGLGTQFMGIYSLRSGKLKLVDVKNQNDDIFHLGLKWDNDAVDEDGYCYGVVRPSQFLWLKLKKQTAGPWRDFTEDSNPALVRYKFKSF